MFTVVVFAYNSYMKKLAIVLIFFIGFTLALAGYKTFMAITHPIKYKSIVEFYSKEFNLSPAVVASVINIESSYNKNARSSKSAIGLMQIKLETANYLNELYLFPELTENELFEIETNIKYGCMYLRYLVNKFENIETTLCAYNAGETRVRSWLNSEFSDDKKTLKTIPFNETKNYLIKFKSNYKYYRKYY